jgi:hypothetical protein
VLLQGGADIEAPIFNNNTALHIAALNGCVDVCRLLLDWGAKLDTPRNGKYTPLLAAAHGGHLSVVKLLVERGADVRVRNDFGRNASQEARSLGKKDVAEWLEEVVKNCDLKENVSTRKIFEYTCLKVHTKTTVLLRCHSFSFSNGTTVQGGPRPPLGVSSIHHGLWRLLSNFNILSSLRLPPLHPPNAVWVSLWGAFLLAH